jgi:16S rRNA (adenine1518-N6/adenine1519-N6)-dimethyltransferase
MRSPAQTLRRYGLRPKKSWGQCFLHDPAVLRRIVDHAGVEPGDTVVEIGAGLGTLTVLLAERAARVHAVEKDRDLVTVLRGELSDVDNVEVVERNALGLDFAAFAGPVQVVGNLPYNIASPLLFHILASRRAIRAATLMLQREVAERLVAPPGRRAYGVPSVLCQQAADVRLCFGVSRGAFVPAPRVDSAVVRLRMLEEPRAPCDDDLFRVVVKAAFGARRKTLRNALGARLSGDAVHDALQAAGIDGGRRGETLTVEEFGRLTRALQG